jgi:hypothetical protein
MPRCSLGTHIKKGVNEMHAIPTSAQELSESNMTSSLGKYLELVERILVGALNELLVALATLICNASQVRVPVATKGT